MKAFIFTTTLSIYLVFFPIYAFLGQDYAGVSNSSSYIIAVLGVVTISMIYIFEELFFNKGIQLRKINILFYLLPFLTLFIYLIEYPINENGKQFLIIYLAFSAPAIYIGTYVAANKSLIYMIKWWDLVSFIITVGLVVSFPRMVFAREIMMGGLNYQSISYMAAFAFSLNLFSLLFGDNYPRFKICQSKIYTLIIYLLMLFQVICVFVGSGRGGGVLLFASSGILLYKKFSEKIKFGKIITMTIIVCLSFILLSLIIPQEVTDTILLGSERIFSYISFEGVDMSETSGRDIVFSTAWTLIKESPLFGYGIFRYVNTFSMYIDSDLPYPHNIFLEFLLQGGVIYLTFWIILFAKLFKKFKQLLRKDDTNFFLIPISVFPFIQLLASGTYLESGLFWFTIAYVFNYKTINV